MTNKSYAKNFWIFFCLTAAVMLFGYLLVTHHLDTPQRVRGQRDLRSDGDSTVAERVKAVGQVNLVSAEILPRSAEAAAPPAAPTKVDGQRVYQTTCVACHGAGIAGAPKVGNSALWAKRIAKGRDALYASAINGLQGTSGVMPAKGGNTALSNAEVKAAVDYIVAQSK